MTSNSDLDLVRHVPLLDAEHHLLLGLVLLDHTGHPPISIAAASCSHGVEHHLLELVRGELPQKLRNSLDLVRNATLLWEQ